MTLFYGPEDDRNIEKDEDIDLSEAKEHLDSMFGEGTFEKFISDLDEYVEKNEASY